jgi:hypothetical protein
MTYWVHNLPIVWMALLVFGLTALVTAAIYLAVMAVKPFPQVCCRRWPSFSLFLLRSPPRRFGLIMIGLMQASIAGLAH